MSASASNLLNALITRPQSPEGPHSELVRLAGGMRGAEE